MWPVLPLELCTDFQAAGPEIQMPIVKGHRVPREGPPFAVTAELPKREGPYAITPPSLQTSSSPLKAARYVGSVEILQDRYAVRAGP